VEVAAASGVTGGGAAQAFAQTSLASPQLTQTHPGSLDPLGDAF